MRSDLIEEAVFNRYLSKTRAYALAALRREGYSKDCLVLQSLEMRYYGQNYQIEVPIGDKESLSRAEIGELFELFRKEHKSLYGYENPGDVVECVGMVVRAIGKGDPPRIGTIAAGAPPAPKEERQVYFGDRDGFLRCPVYERSSMPAGFTISGPAIVEEAVSTTLLLSSNRMLVDSFGNLVIEDKE
jgi:N-methylhydantoinase A